jgi:hypothetical protein
MADSPSGINAIINTPIPISRHIVIPICNELSLWRSEEMRHSFHPREMSHL